MLQQQKTLQLQNETVQSFKKQIDNLNQQLEDKERFTFARNQGEKQKQNNNGEQQFEHLKLKNSFISKNLAIFEQENKELKETIKELQAQLKDSQMTVKVLSCSKNEQIEVSNPKYLHENIIPFIEDYKEATFGQIPISKKVEKCQKQEEQTFRNTLHDLKIQNLQKTKETAEQKIVELENQIELNKIENEQLKHQLGLENYATNTTVTDNNGLLQPSTNRTHVCKHKEQIQAKNEELCELMNVNSLLETRLRNLQKQLDQSNDYKKQNINLFKIINGLSKDVYEQSKVIQLKENQIQLKAKEITELKVKFNQNIKYRNKTPPKSQDISLKDSNIIQEVKPQLQIKSQTFKLLTNQNAKENYKENNVKPSIPQLNLQLVKSSKEKHSQIIQLSSILEKSVQEINQLKTENNKLHFDLQETRKSKQLQQEFIQHGQKGVDKEQNLKQTLDPKLNYKNEIISLKRKNQDYKIKLVEISNSHENEKKSLINRIQRLESLQNNSKNETKNLYKLLEQRKHEQDDKNLLIEELQKQIKKCQTQNNQQNQSQIINQTFQ